MPGWQINCENVWGKHRTPLFNCSYTTYLSFDPSGRIPVGISMKSFPLTSKVSQLTLMQSVSVISKHKLEATCVCAKALGLLTSVRLALTGGSVVTPTPLPSATSDTLTAWGSSGTPPRPGTQTYDKLLVLQPATTQHRVSAYGNS